MNVTKLVRAHGKMTRLHGRGQQTAEVVATIGTMLAGAVTAVGAAVQLIELLYGVKEEVTEAK